jgi:hypothetical protein
MQELAVQLFLNGQINQFVKDQGQAPSSLIYGKKMKYKLFFAAVILIFSCLISGCVSFAKPLNQDYVLDKSKGYIYGRFSLVPPTANSMDGPWDASSYMTIGLLLASDNGSDPIWIKFSKNAGPSIFAVAPGNYTVSRIVFSSTSGVRQSEKKLSSCNWKKITVKSLNAYYIGDYLAEVKLTNKENRRLREWSLKARINNFDMTTKNLEKQWPFISSIPKINLLFMLKVPDRFNV